MKGILDNPNVSEYRWLDIGCGKGQILANLDERLNTTAISKISYYGYDIENDNTRLTRKQGDGSLASFFINMEESSIV
jgi:ubiquinone/menaquinone biosynthesis C-methylase UbiE